MASINKECNKKDPFSGMSTNEKKVAYRHGVTFSLEKKMEVALVLKRLQEEHNHVFTRHLAREAKVSQKYAIKILKELE
jgi:hypothetical protein